MFELGIGAGLALAGGAWGYERAKRKWLAQVPEGGLRVRSASVLWWFGNEGAESVIPAVIPEFTWWQVEVDDQLSTYGTTKRRILKRGAVWTILGAEEATKEEEHKISAADDGILNFIVEDARRKLLLSEEIRTRIPKDRFHKNCTPRRNLYAAWNGVRNQWALFTNHDMDEASRDITHMSRILNVGTKNVVLGPLLWERSGAPKPDPRTRKQLAEGYAKTAKRWTAEADSVVERLHRHTDAILKSQLGRIDDALAVKPDPLAKPVDGPANDGMTAAQLAICKDARAKRTKEALDLMTGYEKFCALERGEVTREEVRAHNNGEEYREAAKKPEVVLPLAGCSWTFLRKDIEGSHRLAVGGAVLVYPTGVAHAYRAIGDLCMPDGPHRLYKVTGIHGGSVDCEPEASRRSLGLGEAPAKRVEVPEGGREFKGGPHGDLDETDNIKVGALVFVYPDDGGYGNPLNCVVPADEADTYCAPKNALPIVAIDGDRVICGKPLGEEEKKEPEKPALQEGQEFLSWDEWTQPRAGPGSTTLAIGHISKWEEGEWHCPVDGKYTHRIVSNHPELRLMIIERLEPKLEPGQIRVDCKNEWAEGMRPDGEWSHAFLRGMGWVACSRESDDKTHRIVSRTATHVVLEPIEKGEGKPERVVVPWSETDESTPEGRMFAERPGNTWILLYAKSPGVTHKIVSEDEHGVTLEEIGKPCA